VDEVGPKNPVLLIAKEGVLSMPLIHAKVFVKVIDDRVPGDAFPTHPPFNFAINSCDPREA
jgi:hypothetical protein